MNAKTVGKAIRQERERQGMRQDELGDRAAMSQPNVSRLERGEHDPKLSTLVSVAAALEVEVSVLVVTDGES